MNSAVSIGVDASKQTLEIAVDGQQGSHTVLNARGAIRTWLGQWRQPCRIGVESTGKYHRLLVDCAIRRGHTVYVLNPQHLFHYMRSLGRRAKTDRLDAQAIARYVGREYADLHAYQAPTKAQQTLDELTQRRRGLVTTLTAFRQSLSGCTVKLRAAARVRRGLQAAIDEIDQRMAALIEQDDRLSGHAQRLQGVPGFGPLLSRVMTHALTRRDFRSSDAFIAYIGYDPRPRDSGQYSGKRYLSKRGPAYLRQLLYIAAMAARRTSLWKPIYERYRARGLASTQVFVILARKLARTAFAIVKQGCDFDPQRLLNKPCAQP
jgi:transposase